MGFQRSRVRSIDIDVSDLDISKTTQEWKLFFEENNWIDSASAGRGIVICAGDIGYSTCAWVSINVLRSKGCNLPIEIWYSRSELSNEMISAFESLGNIQCKNLNDYSDLDIKGYGFKPLSIMLSGFQEVLFLDADNVCCKDPSYLFNDPHYIEYGCLFWKDYWSTSLVNPVWQITESEPSNEQEQESGQILINKGRFWNELCLCLYFNLNYNIYYRLLYGDKDTFRFAWKALKANYYMVPHYPGICGRLADDDKFLGSTIVQFDPSGKPLFLHRNLLKWDVTLPGELSWVIVKRFNSLTQNSMVDFKYSDEYHMHYLDFEGDVYQQSFAAIIDANLEDLCLAFLNDLRNKLFYKNFLIHCYLRLSRFGNKNTLEVMEHLNIQITQTVGKDC